MSSNTPLSQPDGYVEPEVQEQIEEAKRLNEAQVLEQLNGIGIGFQKPKP